MHILVHPNKLFWYLCKYQQINILICKQVPCVISNVGCKEPQGFDLLITFSILLWKSRHFSYTKNCTINNLKKCFFIVIVARTSDNYAGISAAFSFNQRKIVFTIVCSYCSTKSQFPFIPFTQKRPPLWKDQEGPVILPEVTLKNHEHVFFFLFKYNQRLELQRGKTLYNTKKVEMERSN